MGSEKMGRVACCRVVSCRLCVNWPLNGRCSEEKDWGVLGCDILHSFVQYAKAANRAMSALSAVKKCLKHF